MWVLIDNYDSFTYILHHYLLGTGHNCEVYRNDEITIDELAALNPDRIIISPGPETPAKAGITMSVIEAFYQTTPILGICLGHQALGVHFGAHLRHAPCPMHGKTSEVEHNGHRLFSGIPKRFPVMRYHSLILEGTEGTGLDPVAISTDDRQVMAVVHEIYPCTGIQFHPESIGTADGATIIRNWANCRY